MRRSTVALGTIASGCVGVIGSVTGQGGGRDRSTSEPGSETDGSSESSRVAPSKPVKIAFIGDQGLKETAREVLRLIEREGTDLVVHSGDFDYADNPEAWESMLDEELGQDFPYVATIGGHDVPAWEGYERALRKRLERVDELKCTGDIGLQSTCTYRGIQIVQTSVDVLGGSEDAQRYPTLTRRITGYDHERYVESQLSGSNAGWRLCSWHEPHRSTVEGASSWLRSITLRGTISAMTISKPRITPLPPITE